MKEWKQGLDRLPTNEAGHKEANETSSKEIILQFMKEEIHTRFQAAKDSFSKPGLNIVIFPISPKDISTNQPIVYIAVQKQSNGNSYEYSLKFNQETGLIIEATLIGKYGVPTLGSITLEGESPTTLVEWYIEQFREQLS